MRALISVSNKNHLLDLVACFKKHNIDIISSGGTALYLKNNGYSVTEVSDITGFKECLDGRVKTLHPSIHAGILAKRDNPKHMDTLKDLNITPIDFVVVNLYPFKETIIKDNTSFEEAIEQIDIGGPTLLRAAAKNAKDVVVCCDTNDYYKVIEELDDMKEISLETKKYLQYKTFCHTAAYDSLIASYLRDYNNYKDYPQELTLTFEKVQDVRYGENPHQTGAYYKEVLAQEGTLPLSKQLHGKELSFNNVRDASEAISLLKEFTRPTVVCSKHGNPCGVGSGDDIVVAYNKAYYADKTSVFGGIIALNREVNREIALSMSQIFLEVVIAPAYSDSALDILMQKKNIRLLELNDIGLNNTSYQTFRSIPGGLIIQDSDDILLDDMTCVTNRKPTDQELKDLIFSYKVVKHEKSNAICICKNEQTIGIGPGQVNRIWAVKQCIEHAEELIGPQSSQGCVLASDAFFPFNDCVIAAHEAGITAIIQPGGSIRDQESIDKCNEYGIAMIFTGTRHFLH